jgi:hypothetical protein
MKTSAERSSQLTDLRKLQIERAPVPPQQNRNKRLILIGATVVVVCGIVAIALRAVIRPTPVVETARVMRLHRQVWHCSVRDRLHRRPP